MLKTWGQKVESTARFFVSSSGQTIVRLNIVPGSVAIWNIIPIFLLHLIHTDTLLGCGYVYGCFMHTALPVMSWDHVVLFLLLIYIYKLTTSCKTVASVSKTIDIIYQKDRFYYG